MSQELIIDDLTYGLRGALACDDAAAATRLARAIIEAGGSVTMESDEPDEDDCCEGDLPLDRCVGTTQLHRILVDGEEVATLERYGWSHYGDPDHPSTPCGEWTTESGESDTEPSGAWRAVCNIADLGDDWDYVPGADEHELAEPETDPDGEYCLWWSTVGDDDGPRPAKRYATYADAAAACQLAQLELRVRNRGKLLCGFAVGVLVDGEWQMAHEDD